MSRYMRKWIYQTLTKDDILESITAFKASYPKVFNHLTEDDLKQVTHCLNRIYLNYHAGHIGGSFLRALASDSWREIMDHADDHNIRGMYLYRLYLKNNAPQDWREKALKLTA